MKQILLTVFTGLILTSCSKKDDNYKPLRTPLHEIMDAKFISDMGSGLIVVDYNAYRPNKEVDTEVLLAAQKTTQSPYNYDRIQIVGKNITSLVKKGSNALPDSYYFTFDSEYYNKAKEQRPWKGRLVISKANSLISKTEFENSVNVSVQAINTGEEAQILNKSVSDNVMIVTFALTKMIPGYFSTVTFKVQSNVAVTYSVEYEIEYEFNSASRVVAAVPKAHTQPTITNIGNNTTEFKGELFAPGAEQALSEFLASWYWNTYVRPDLQQGK